MRYLFAITWLFSVFYASPCLALIVVPSLNSPVIDDAAMLSPSEQQQLRVELQNIFRSGGPQMQLWSVQNLEGEDISALGTRAVETWKLGRQGKDDGVLLLLSSTERKTRLEIGRGLEGLIPDALAARLLRSVLKPALQSGDVYQGILKTFEQVVTLAGPDGREARQKLESQDSGSGKISFIYLLIVGLLILVSFFSRGSRGGGAAATTGLWIASAFLGGRGSSRGSGWGGGGGGFSGGGSSGNW